MPWPFKRSTQAMRAELDTLMRQRDELTRHIDALARDIARREALPPRIHGLSALHRTMASPNRAMEDMLATWEARRADPIRVLDPLPATPMGYQPEGGDMGPPPPPAVRG